MPQGSPLRLGSVRCLRSLVSIAALATTRTNPTLNPALDASIIVTADLLFVAGELADVDLNGLKKKFQKRFERWTLRDRIVIAGIDLSFNIEENKEVGWQVHLYVLIEGKHTSQLEEAIKATFRRNRRHGCP